MATLLGLQIMSLQYMSPQLMVIMGTLIVRMVDVCTQLMMPTVIIREDVYIIIHIATIAHHTITITIMVDIITDDHIMVTGQDMDIDLDMAIGQGMVTDQGMVTGQGTDLRIIGEDLVPQIDNHTADDCLEPSGSFY